MNKSTKRILAISDIHGCGKTFIKLINQIAFNKSDTLVIIGDLIDRGLNTKLLIDKILKLQKEGYNIIVTLGNHEDLMFKSVHSVETEHLWLVNGGLETLKSFGIDSYKELEPKYKTFFEGLPLKTEIDNYIFVHAGINNIQFKDPFLPNVVLYTRNWYEFLDRKWLGNRYIIHGHTPQTKEEIIKLFDLFETNRYLNIDGGCCYPANYRRKKEPEKPIELQKLYCVDLTNRKLYFQDNCEL